MKPSLARRFLGLFLAVVQILTTAGGLVLVMPSPALALTCATAGKDGAGGTLSGTVNSYYPGSASASAGATSISVGSKLTGSASANIASGDLLLVVQISGATVNGTNTSAYGSGGSSGTGWTALNQAGKYEYVKATSAVSGGSVSIAGAGSGGGLVNSYTYSAASSSPAQFQVVRVPQYTTATLGSSLTGVAWQFASGTTLTGAGGIIAIDVSGALTLGGTVNMSGQGFNGGHNVTNSALVNPTTYTYSMTSASNVTNGYQQGEKGEGIAGAPRYTAPYSTSGTAGTPEDVGATIADFISTGSGVGGGAPANAGGGGNNFSTNSSGGGGAGGANGGAGGAGGYTGNFAGGYGGTAVSPGASFIVLGGGGGAGDIYGAASGDGGSGGGMVLIRSQSVSGTGTIQSNGIAGANGSTTADSGGGGAGGTVMVTTTTGTLSGLTVNAKGGGGGNTTSWEGGGGGGGGAVLLSSTGATVSVAGGAFVTGGTNNPVAGSTGYTSTSITPSSIPGVSSGAECASTSTMTITNPTAQNVAPGATVTDTFTLKNTSASSGTFALTGAATFGGTASGTTLTGFVLAGAASGTCSTAAPCTYATLNSQAGMAGIAANGTQTVAVVYAVSGSATGGQTIQPSITANVTVSGSTSSNVTNTAYSDTVVAEPRLDAQISATQPTNGSQSITWTVNVNNGGNAAASYSKSACELVWGNNCSSNVGTAVVVAKVPTFNGTTTGISGSSFSGTSSGTITMTCSTCNAYTYYFVSTKTSGAPSTSSDWCYYWSSSGSTSNTCSGNVTWIAVYFNFAATIPSNPSGSSGAGSVTSPQMSFTFVTNQPSGAGASNAGSVSALANVVVDDSSGNVVAPTIASGTSDANSASQLTAMETNTTPSSGTTAPGGASNTASSQAYLSATMTITDPSAENVTPADVEIDTFTLQNTSSSSGTFALTGNPTFGGTASGTTLTGYVLNGASSGTCSSATPCTYTTLNAQSGMAGIATNGTITVGVEFQVSSSATSGQTIQPSITANVTVSGTTSSNVTNTTYSDTLTTEARLDAQTSVSGPSSYTGVITWTVKANNGGGYAAADLQSVKAVLGSATNGIALFIPVPSFGGTALTLQAQPAAPTLSGATSGSAALLYYNATACSSSPTSGWSTTYAASSKCLAILLYHGTGGVELPSATGGSSGAGSVTTAQITFSFTTNQPSGSGAGNANAVTLLVSSAIGGNLWETGTTPIVGQGVTIGTADAATASLLNGIQSNATSSSGTTTPGGASNSVGAQAYDVIPQLGPYNGIGSVGSYDGVVAVNASDAFTAVSYQPAGGAALVNSGTTPGTPVGNTINTSGVTTVNVPNAFTYEEVSAGGTLTLSGTAPSGWRVQICQDSSGPVCTASGIWTTVNAAGTTSSSILTLTSLQTLTNYKFWAVYTLASGSNVTAFSRTDATVVANDGTTSTNATTHNELYAGFVPLTRTATISSTGCPSGVTPPAGGVCPSGMILYTIDYRNIVAGGSASGSTEPESAFPEVAAGTLVLTENGSYFSNTNGLNEALVAGANGTSTFGDSTTNSVFKGATIGSTSFTDTVGGASFKLVPSGFTGTNKGQQGTLTFRVVVQ